jgi:hypothetical protein
MDEDKLIILVQGHECLYNLQHNDYDNNLVNYNCWKEIAGEWHGSGRVGVGERHGMCESAFNTAVEWHGMCESAFSPAAKFDAIEKPGGSNHEYVPDRGRALCERTLDPADE